MHIVYRKYKAIYCGVERGIHQEESSINMALCGLFPTSVKCIEPFRQPSRLANKLRQRKLGYHGTFKQPHVVKAINDNKEPADDQEKDENKTKAELNLLLSLLVA